VQISKEEAEAIKDLDLGFGSHYHDINGGKDLIEFHVDYWNRFCFTDKQAPALTLARSTIPILEPTMSIQYH
jgi:hypothetical protein